MSFNIHAINKKPVIIIGVISFFALAQMSFRLEDVTAVDQTINYFSKEATVFSTDTKELHLAITAIASGTQDDATAAKATLARCRNQYKKISFFLEYFFPSESRVFNAAAVTEVEDAELEFIEPMGLQQIENLLFQPAINDIKKELLVQSESVYTSASDIRSLLYQFEATDAQVLESLRIELIRIITLYITGYDAPELKTGITEARTAINAIQKVLAFYSSRKPVAGKALNDQLSSAQQYLAGHKDFDSFSRMEFLRRFGLPLQKSLGQFIKSLHLELNSTAYLDYKVSDIFSKGAINVSKLNSQDAGKETVELGEKLFSENALSVNNKRSCATCHQPGLYFNDNLARSLTLNGHGTVTRNAPTLLYAGLQHAGFWDGRAVSISNLVKEVILNSEEMNGEEEVIMSRLMKDTSYRVLFNQVFPSVQQDSIGLNEIASSIAAYVQTLNPMTSAFDKYINGDVYAMDTNAVKGFDLFMGKAKCGSCHFAPFFNSLLPPFYDVSEYEIIGATATDDMVNAKQDTDRGRFAIYPVRFYDGAFKTPTVRNVARTAPYMHNGAFGSLDSVVAFYDKGGGEGIGIANKLQTLSPSPLNLSSLEKMQLVVFMNALTDEPITINLNSTAK